MSDLRGRIAAILSDHHSEEFPDPVVTHDSVDAILAAVVDALTSETLIRHGTYVLVDHIAGAPIDEHLTRVVNSMLRDAGITKGGGDE